MYSGSSRPACSRTSAASVTTRPATAGSFASTRPSGRPGRYPPVTGRPATGPGNTTASKHPGAPANQVTTASQSCPAAHSRTSSGSTAGPSGSGSPTPAAAATATSPASRALGIPATRTGTPPHRPAASSSPPASSPHPTTTAWSARSTTAGALSITTSYRCRVSSSCARPGLSRISTPAAPCPAAHPANHPESSTSSSSVSTARSTAARTAAGAAPGLRTRCTPAASTAAVPACRTSPTTSRPPGTSSSSACPSTRSRYSAREILHHRVQHHRVEEPARQPADIISSLARQPHPPRQPRRGRLRPHPVDHHRREIRPPVLLRLPAIRASSSPDPTPSSSTRRGDQHST